MIELIETHEPTKDKLNIWLREHKISFRQYDKAMREIQKEKYLPIFDDRPMPKVKPMIDTDFEHNKQQAKRGLSKFEQVVRKYEYTGTGGAKYREGQNWYNGNRVYVKTPPPPEPKPHWFERFLRWWYDL